MNAVRRLAVVAAILLMVSGAAAAATNAEQYNTRTFLDQLGGLFSLTSCEPTAQLRSTGFDVNADTVDAQLEVVYDTFCSNDEQRIGASVELYVVDENGNWLRSQDIVCEDVIAPEDGDYEGGNTVIKFSNDVCKINTPAASELDDGHEVMLGFYATTVGHVDDAEQVATGIVGGQQDETTDSDTTTSGGSSGSTTSTDGGGSENPDLSYQFDTSVDGRTVTTDFTIANSGGSMSESWIVEQQIKTESGSFLSLSTLSGPKTCDPSHPENVHREFRVDADDSVQGTLTSTVPDSVGGGTFLVKTIVTTECGAGFVKDQWRLGMVTLDAPTGETVPSTDVEASENGTVDLSKVLGRDVPKTVWVQEEGQRCTTVAGVQAKADGKKWFRSQENCKAALDDGIIESKAQLVGIGAAGLAGLTVVTALGGVLIWRFM